MVRIRVKRPREGLIALLEYDFYDIENKNKKYTCVIDTGAPQTILPFYIKRTLGRAHLKQELGFTGCLQSDV